MMDGMTLPNSVLYIINKLEEHGYRADVVGGCVRDSLLRRAQSDFDLTTNALPDEILRVFSENRVLKTGIKHGTVGVVVDGVVYEITTYRIDGAYMDNRHPDEVSFTSQLSDDLSRRDFTVNALCYNPKYGYTDLFGGVTDIKSKIIRAVGDPVRRFTEDALRILRALRFASVLDFSIENRTAEALDKCKHLLLGVSKERIYSEILKLVGGVAAYRIINDYWQVLSVVAPGIEGIVLPPEAEFRSLGRDERLISVFYSSCDSPVSAFCDFCESLKTDRRIRDLGKKTLACALSLEKIDAPTLRRLMYRYGEEAVGASVRIASAFARIDKGDLDLLAKILGDNMPYKISHLAISGCDLVSLGIVGEDVGRALEDLLFAVIDGRCENRRESLLAFVSKP